MSSNAEVVLRHAPKSVPIAADFAFQECAMPVTAPRDGLLVRVIALSLDPYLGSLMRGRYMGQPAPLPGNTLPGTGIGEVVASDSNDFKRGDMVVGEFGWRRFASVFPAGVRKVDATFSPAAHLGVLGMPGLTAWAGVTQLAKVREGDVFAIDAAAGPVGGTAGQIARILGARAIGIAGGQAKCALVRDQYRFDDCIDYKQPDWPERLKAACTPGISVHFESVGLSILTQVTPLLTNYARVVLCGLADHYQADGPPAAFPLGQIVFKRAAFLGLVVYDFMPRLAEWTELAGKWLRDGSLTYHEDEAPNLEAAPAHFEKLMRGDNVGKAIVRIGPDPT